MNLKRSLIILMIAGSLSFVSCLPDKQEMTRVRTAIDTVGFAHLDWQMDSIMARISGPGMQDTSITSFYQEVNAKVIISPHDDYAYVGSLYPATLKNIRAKTVIIFGVAHKARLLNLEDQIIFDSYDYWKGPYGNVKVSDVREEICRQLPSHLYQVNDSMQQIEHSIEALIPFLQYYNRHIEIVPILVPSMSYDRMMEIARPLSMAIKKATIDQGMNWGNDIAFLISTDAVHYGDEDWGGKNFALYGTDSMGYARAIAHENRIMNAISGALDPRKVKAFCNFTVEEDDYKEYKWTWCGRYSVPMGLLTAYELNQALQEDPLTGSIIGYSNSIDHHSLMVNDLKMGKTAPASVHHWVGYAAIGYK